MKTRTTRPKSTESDRRGDEELRGRFEELRDNEPAPPRFASLWQLGEGTRDRHGADARGRTRVWIAAAAVVLVAVVLVLLVPRSDDRSSRYEPPAIESLAWTSTTDFLLEVPGSDLLSSLPQIDRPLPDIVLGSWPEGGLPRAEARRAADKEDSR